MYHVNNNKITKKSFYAESHIEEGFNDLKEHKNGNPYIEILGTTYTLDRNLTTSSSTTNVTYSNYYYPYVKARSLGVFSASGYAYSPTPIHQSLSIGLTDKLVATKFLQNGVRGRGDYQFNYFNFDGPYHYYIQSINGQNINVYKGLFTINGKIYYAYPQNHLYSQVLTQKNYIPAGVLTTGWQTINGNKYYFNPQNFTAAVGIQEIDGAFYLFNSNGYLVFTSGLHIFEGKYYNIKSSKLSTGWDTIDGNKYYFNPQTKNASIGLVNINGNYYDFNTNGTLVTDTFKYINNHYYYFGSNGAAKTGWFTVNGNTYHGLFNGACNANGIFYVGNSLYGFNSNGVLAKGGYQTINGRYYYFNADGTPKTGWIFNSNLGAKQYFDQRLHGAAAKGSTKINGTYYFFKSNGAEVTNNFETISGHLFYYGENGLIKNQWINIPSTYNTPSEKYYADSQGICYKSGVFNINGLGYGFNEKGQMLTGIQEVNGKHYSFNTLANGEMLGAAITGWALNPNGNGYVYYDPQELGAAATGLHLITGNYYYFNNNGVEVQNQFETVNNKLYFIGVHGTYMNSWFSWNGNYYYAGSDGACYKNGAFTIGNLEYGFDSSGKMLTGYQTLNGKNYDFNNSGAANTGWIWNPNLNDYQYFAPNLNGAAVTGLNFIGGTYYYFNENGTEVRNTWKVLDGKTYYFGWHGTYRNTWFTYDGVSFYAGNDGYCTEIQEGGHTYPVPV